MSNTVYGVGVGPGDPELITAKARRILREVDVVFAPTGGATSRSLAAQIAITAGVEPSRITSLLFPMTRDEDRLDKAWDRAAAQVAKAIAHGADAAFVTLGDPAIYSTWTYLREALLRRCPSLTVKAVPGIMAMNAAAATLGVALVEKGERLALLPLPEPVDLLDRYRDLFEILAIYKIGARVDLLRDYLEARDLSACSHLVVGVGLAEEWAGSFAELPPHPDGYLSCAFIRTRGGA